VNPLKRSNLVTLSKVAVALFWVALFTATHLPPTSHLLPSAVYDKLEHAVGYAGLAILLAATWELGSGRLNGRHVGIVWLVVIAYGAFDEITQILVDRDCEFADWGADAAGAAVGLFLFVAVRKLLEHRSRVNE
jgi:VanZ family protein